MSEAKIFEEKLNAQIESFVKDYADVFNISAVDILRKLKFPNDVNYRKVAQKFLKEKQLRNLNMTQKKFESSKECPDIERVVEDYEDTFYSLSAAEVLKMAKRKDTIINLLCALKTLEKFIQREDEALIGSLRTEVQFDEKLQYSEAMERGRAGGQIMGTQIEGKEKLARTQEAMERRQAGTQMERLFLAMFLKIAQVYQGFASDDEVVLKERFLALQHSNYKNPCAFILAHITLGASNKITKKGLHEATKIAAEIDENIMEEDIIRYCRLILSRK